MKNSIPPLVVIIFSKDRACQLDLLLRTIKKQLRIELGDVYIIYYTTSDEYEKGYEKLMGRDILPVTLYQQESFKSDFIRCLKECDKQTPLVMLLVDDIVFFRPLDETAPIKAMLNDERVISVSTRQAREYTPDRLPEFEREDSRKNPHVNLRDCLLWNWQSADPGTWGYPMSVDGNVFRIKDLLTLVEDISFRTPNSLEGRLATDAKRAAGRWNPPCFASRVAGLFRSVSPLYKKRTHCVAYLEAKIYNNPLNLVSAESATWHGNTAVEKLNEAYLGGWIINDAPFYETVPQAPHHLVDEIELTSNSDSPLGHEQR